MTSVISVTRDLIQTSISLIRASDKFGEVSVNTSSLIGALEQTEINRFAEDVPLDFFHQHCARLESVGRGFHARFEIQSVQLQHVVMFRAVGCGSRTSI